VSVSNDSGPPERAYWAYAVGVLACVFVTVAVVDGRYGLIFTVVSQGVWTTVWVAVCAFAAAAGLGLLLAMAARSPWIVLRQTARLYIELMRGLPALVILLYVTFAATPAVVALYQWVCAEWISQGILPDILVRDVSNTARGIVALSLAYSAFLAEVFRAGLQSVEKAQIEAAQVLEIGRAHV